MTKLFAIFARADADRVAPVLEALRGGGFEVAREPGDAPVEDRIDQAAAEIGAADAVVALLTEGVWSSTPFERELRIAREYGKPLVAATLESSIDADGWARLYDPAAPGAPDPVFDMEVDVDLAGPPADEEPASPPPLVTLWDPAATNGALRVEAFEELIAAVHTALGPTADSASATDVAKAVRGDATGAKTALATPLAAALAAGAASKAPAENAAGAAERTDADPAAPPPIEPALAGALWESVRNSNDISQLRAVRRMVAADPHFAGRADARIEELLRRKREQEDRADRARVRERLGSVGATTLAVALAGLMFWAIVQRADESAPLLDTGAGGAVVEAPSALVASLQEEVADLEEQLTLALEDVEAARAAGASPGGEVITDGAVAEENRVLREANTDLERRIVALETSSAERLRTETAALRAANLDLERKVIALETEDAATMRAEIDALRAANAELESKVVSFETADVETMRTEIAALRAANADLERRVISFETDGAEAAAPVPAPTPALLPNPALEAELDAARDRIAGLEEQLAAQTASLEAAPAAPTPEQTLAGGDASELRAQLAAARAEADMLEKELETSAARSEEMEAELVGALRELSASRRETKALQAYVDRVRVLKGWPANSDPGVPGAGGGVGLVFEHYLAELNDIRARREASVGAQARFPIVSRGDLIRLQLCLQSERDILVGADGVFGLRTMRALADLDPVSASAVLDCVERS